MEQIIKLTEQVINDFCRAFQETPSLFYNEYDVTCQLCSRLVNHLAEFSTRDRAGHLHSLVHQEYPTPFRCHMRNLDFKEVSDDFRDNRGKKLRRGRYDVVVLNPTFIKESTYNVLKAQNYELWKREVSLIGHPLFLYVLEIAYRRDPFKMSRGSDADKAIKTFAACIKQDHSKLRAGLKHNNAGAFGVQSLVFVKASDNTIVDRLRSFLTDIPNDEIALCVA